MDRKHKGSVKSPLPSHRCKTHTCNYSRAKDDKGTILTPVLAHSLHSKTRKKAPPPLFFGEGSENRREGERHISKHSRVNSTSCIVLFWSGVTSPSPTGLWLPRAGTGPFGFAFSGPRLSPNRRSQNAGRKDRGALPRLPPPLLGPSLLAPPRTQHGLERPQGRAAPAPAPRQRQRAISAGEART